MSNSFGVHSEVGKLHKVIVHRPNLDLKRLTPNNHDDLLFDDILQVLEIDVTDLLAQKILHRLGIENGEGISDGQFEQGRPVHGTEKGFNFTQGNAGTVRGTNQRPGAGPCDHVRADTIPLQHLQHANVRRAKGSASTQGDADLSSGEKISDQVDHVI